MKNIISELYLGNICELERRSELTHEEVNIYNAIQCEMEYFAEALAPDEFQRVLAIEDMFINVHSIGNELTYLHAFKAAMLMCSVFMREEAEA